MAVKQLSDGGADGVKVGQSAADLVGFYGFTPIVQPAATAQSAVASTAITAITAGETLVGVATQVAALNPRIEAMRVLQHQIRSDLIALGLLKGSA
jgi:hypothetical protein